MKNKYIKKLEDELDKKSIFITKLDTEKNNEIKKINDELENVYKGINKETPRK